MSENVTHIPLQDVKERLHEVSTPPKPTKIPPCNITSSRSVIEFPKQAWFVLITLLSIFVVIGASYFWVITGHSTPSWLPPLMTVLWIGAGVGVLGLMYWIWCEFTRFGNELFAWTERLRKNDLSQGMPIHRRVCPSRRIREEINTITQNYSELAEKQRQHMSRQEAHIKRKSYHLQVLHDVATAINRAESLEDLLHRFLNTLRNVVHAEAATIRLLDGENNLRVVASIGLDDDVMDRETTITADQCTCGKVMGDQQIKVRHGVSKCEHLLGDCFKGHRETMEMLAIPLQYRGKTLGMYNLFVSKERQADLEAEHELLISIGRHLGMAIEKASVEEEAHMLSIMEERTRMAHELHDSLAQTIASLRFKVRLLDDSILQGNDQAVTEEVESLEQSVDEAYAEVRSLITHFRAPIDGKGVVRVVERMSERFRQETHLDVFFYHNWNLPSLDPDIEIDVIRIVQEALNNIRKHSGASTVRILMYSSEDGRCSILVEDDGCGLPEPLPEPNPVTGEHVGLHIMQERAERLGGEVQFESDDEEGGTLVQLNFEFNDIKSRPLSAIIASAD